VPHVRSKCNLWLVLLTAVACLATADNSEAQVDTAAAAEARQALREVRTRYGNFAEWNAWAAALNLPDVQFELLAGERGEAGVLQLAVVDLLAGRVPQFSEAPFARLAKALDVRAQEMTPLAIAEWPSECARAAEAYQPVTVENLELARKDFERRLDDFELVFPPVRAVDSQWNKFLYWPESRALASPTPGPSPAGEMLDRLEMRWAGAPAVWDDRALFEASLAARSYIRLLRGYLAGETRAQHTAAWQELSELLVSLASDSSDTSRIAAAVAQRERLGEASRLTASIRKELSRPNLVVQINRAWLQSRFEQEINEPYQVNDVFAGTRSVGSGRLVGTMRAEILPSSSVGRWLLSFNGTSTARASGSQDRVQVVSRATTRVAATKPFRIDARGLSPQFGTAGAVTNIVYESIDSPGLPRRRSRAVSETNARRPQAERESAAYARRSILDRINEEAAKVAQDFNTSYHADLRDPRINALRPSPEIRMRAGAETVRWECLLEGTTTFGAPEAPPEFGTETDVVMSVAASALEEQAMIDLAGRELNGEQLVELLGGSPQEAKLESTESKDAFHVTFAADPCDVRFEERLVRVRLYITRFDSADVNYPAMAVDVSYRPEARDGRALFVRQGRVRVSPLATGDGEAPKTSGRQQTLRLAVERKLAKVLTAELEGGEVKLPFSPEDESALRVERVQLKGPWLQMALEPVSRAKS